MTNEQLARFRALLEAGRGTVNRGILAAQNDALEAEESGREGEGGDVYQQGVLADTALGVGTLRTEQSHEIDEALLRIGRGEYGRCEVCGREIELERLEAIPTARLCAEHAHQADRRDVPRL